MQKYYFYFNLPNILKVFRLYGDVLFGYLWYLRSVICNYVFGN